MSPLAKFVPVDVTGGGPEAPTPAPTTTTSPTTPPRSRGTSTGMLQVLRYINAVCSPDNGLTPSERLVLICHATHVNNATGETFVSSETVAAETGVTDRTVRKARRMARESGWLTERRPAKRRSGHATVWALPPLDRGQTPDGWGRDTRL